MQFKGVYLLPQWILFEKFKFWCRKEIFVGNIQKLYFALFLNLKYHDPIKVISRPWKSDNMLKFNKINWKNIWNFSR